MALPEGSGTEGLGEVLHRNTGLFSFMVAVPFIVVMLRASSMFDRTCIGENAQSRDSHACRACPSPRCGVSPGQQVMGSPSLRDGFGSSSLP